MSLWEGQPDRTSRSWLSYGSVAMTASEYQKRAQECLDLSKSVAPKVRATLFETAKAWLLLADDALDHEEPLDVGPPPPSRCNSAFSEGSNFSNRAPRKQKAKLPQPY